MSMISEAWGKGESGWKDLYKGFSGETAQEGIEAAAELQLEGTKLTLAQQQAQWEQAQKWMAPYMGAGEQGLQGMMGLAGMGGPEQEAQMLRRIESSPTFRALVSQGEDAILQNAAATGGLRGGNTQGALARYRPGMLRSEIENRYNKLAGITGTGQATAVGGVAAGQGASQQMAQTTMTGAESQANAILGGVQAKSTLLRNMMQIGAMYAFS